MDLNTTVNLIEAKENAKLDSESLHKSSNVSRLSDYKKGVKNDQGNSGVKNDQGNSAKVEGTCGWCKRKGHGSNATEETRKQLCPAFNEE